MMIVGCVALIGTTEPPAEPQPTPAEPVDNAEFITRAIAAQEKAGRLAERATEAFDKHEFLWNQIAQGPQATAARLMADAEVLSGKDILMLPRICGRTPMRSGSPRPSVV